MCEKRARHAVPLENAHVPYDGINVQDAASFQQI